MQQEARERFTAIYQAVESYYASALARHGPSPEGVDWDCASTQQLRFEQLLQLGDFSHPVSLNDLGCGYGALWALLKSKGLAVHVDYEGVDLSDAMVDAANQLHSGAKASFIVGNGLRRVADFSVASGIFNVMPAAADQSWAGFVAATLDDLAAHSRRGFAVNFLAPVVGHTSERLYRSWPNAWVEHCKTSYGAEVEVLGDYGLREYTILARYGV